jgi:hypothetical protein
MDYRRRILHNFQDTVNYMSSRLVMLFFMGVCLRSFSQNCNCEKEFLFVKDYIEKNHPGYNAEIRFRQEEAYEKLTADLLGRIRADLTGKYCQSLISEYLLFLKDRHTRYSLAADRPVNEENPSSLDSFLQSSRFLSTEIIPLDSTELMRYLSGSKDPVEGVYRNTGAVYTVAIIRNRNARRDYCGIILKSSTKLWKAGQVKLELKKMNDSLFHMNLSYRNHVISLEPVEYRNQRLLLDGWEKIRSSGETVVSGASALNTDVINFRVLNPTTGLLSIRSFSGGYTTKFDSAYAAIIPESRKRPNLIIDLRNNGGGSDANFNALMPLIFTDTIFTEAVDLYVSHGNVAAYERMRDLYKSDPATYGRNGYLAWEYPLQKMKKAQPNSFVLYGPAGRKFYKGGGPGENPRKVVLVYNRFCASSCEQLILYAAFSKKVITAGEHSGGYIDYGNVMEIPTICGNILNCTTTIKRGGKKYDFTGRPPQYTIPPDHTDWIGFAEKLLLQER